MSKPYKVALIGGGNIANLHLDGIKRHSEDFIPWAVIDPNADNARTCSEKYGIEQIFSTVRELIESKGADCAIVCTPTHIRQQVVLPLLDAGLPVLCEKPFAETYNEAATMAECAGKSNTKLAINQNFRQHYSFDIAKEALRDSKLGKPLYMVHTSCGLRRDVGWRNERSRYAMSVMCIHWFDGYRYMLGQEPISIYCRGVNSPATEGHDDTAISAILDFPGGTVVSLSFSMSSYANADNCLLDCENGSLVMEYSQLTLILDGQEPVIKKNPYDKVEATHLLLSDLMRAHENNDLPTTSAEDNLKSMQILEAAYRSFTEKRLVKISEVLN